MLPPRLVYAVALSCLLAAGFSTSSRAADVTPAQAVALEAQLRNWMASLVTPVLDIGERPVKLVAEGDHFDVEIPAPAILSTSGLMMQPGLSIRLKARPLDGGRWALDDLVLPSPVKFSLPPMLGSRDDAPRGDGTTSFSGFEYHAVLDPTFATPSHFDMNFAGLEFAGPTASTSFGRVTGHDTWEPAAGGTIDMVSEGTVENTVSRSISPANGGVITYTIDKSRLSARINTLSPDNLAALVRSIAHFIPTIVSGKGNGILTPAQRILARTAVLALRDLSGGAEISESFDGIRGTIDGHSGSLANTTLSAKIGVTDGWLAVSGLVSADRFDSPEIPVAVRDLLPWRVVLKPRLSGIPRDDLIKLLLKAIDNTDEDMVAVRTAVEELQSVGPFEVGFDEVEIRVGDATLFANGSLKLASPRNVTGEADITVIGLDGLIKKANASPDVAETVRMLVFLKGIGREDGDETVWNVTYEKNRVIVNDTDLTSLISGHR